MAAQTQRWLNIVVDGHADLAPYWPKIVSDYLEKIVRSFCDDSLEKENNAVYELGLVLYTSNSNIGYFVQLINWTKDMDFFLSCLPSLVLNGDYSNNLITAEGLVKALMMYPKPPSTHRGQRHCVMVAISEPVPRRTLLSVPVPVVQYGTLISTQVEPKIVDVFEVAQMFSPLEVSFSMITPTEHSIFRAIFNLGNNVTEIEFGDPLSNYRIGEFTVLLSKNFKEAREVFHGNIACGSPRKTSVESITLANDATIPNVSSSHLPEGLCSAAMTTTIQEQTIEATEAVRLESQVAVPSATPQIDDACSSANTSMKVIDDLIAELYANDDDVIFLSPKRSRTSTPLQVFNLEGLLQPDNHHPLDYSRNSHEQQRQAMSSLKTNVLSMEDLREFEVGFEQALMCTNEQEISKNKTSNIIDLTSSSSTEVTNSSLATPTNAPSPSIGTVSTTPVVESRVSVDAHNPILCLGESSNSSHVLPQTTTGLSPAGPQAMQGEVDKPAGGVINTGAAVRSGLVEPLETHQTSSAGFAYGDSFFPDVQGRAVIRFEANSSALPNHAEGQSIIIQFEPSSSTTQQNFLGSSTHFANHDVVRSSSSIQFEASSSSALHQTFLGAGAQCASDNAVGSSSIIHFGASSAEPNQTFLGASTQFARHDANRSSLVIRFSPSSSSTPCQTSVGANTHQFASHNAVGSSLVIQSGPSSSTPHPTYHCTSTQFASHDAIEKSSSIQVGASSSAPHQTFPNATQIASHNAMGNSPSIQFKASSSTPHQTLLGANTQFSSHNAMGTSSFIQFEALSSAPHQTFPHVSTQIASHHVPKDSSVIRFRPSSSASPQMFPHGHFVGVPNGQSSSTLQIQQHVPAGYHRGLVTNLDPSRPHASAVGANTCVPPVPRLSQICDPKFCLPHLSSKVDFNEYVQTWEGSIAGSTYARKTSFYRAKAFKKTTAPLMLTVQWETKLLICHYIPKKAVEYTKRQMKSKPDSVFFYITEFNNLDLFHHLMRKRVCARIDLPSQVLMLSPISENVFFYEGEVFPRDVLFVEPA